MTDITRVEGEIVSPPQLNLKVKADFQPTFRDMVTLESMGEKDEAGKPLMKWAPVVELFNRAFVGGVDSLPVDQETMSLIGAALKVYFESKSNPND